MTEDVFIFLDAAQTSFRVQVCNAGDAGGTRRGGCLFSPSSLLDVGPPVRLECLDRRKGKVGDGMFG